MSRRHSSRRLRLSASFFGAVALAALLVAPTRAADPVTWKFNVGEGNHYRMTQKMTMDIPMGEGTSETQDITNVIDMSWVVDEVKDDGSARLTQTIDRMQMTIEPKGRDKVEFDSESTDEPQGFAAAVAPLFRELSRASFKLTMSPRGKVSEIEVPESLLKALAASPGAAAMGELATAKGLEETMSRMSLEMPETLTEGETWTTTSEIQNPVLGKQTITITYKYVGPTDKDGVTYEVFEPTLDIAFAGGAATATIEEQKSSGEVRFNRTAGRLESTKLDHTMKLKLGVAGQTLNQTLTQSNEMQWVPAEEK
jgi:Family of unknown function (DUF6263)